MTSVMRIDVNDPFTWPGPLAFQQVKTVNGWGAKVCELQCAFILVDGDKRSTFHNGVLLLTPVGLTAFPLDTFRALYPNYPKELS